MEYVRVVEVAFTPGLVCAVVMDTVEGSILEVYRSAVLHPDDELLDPAQQERAGCCSSFAETQDIDAPDLLSKRGVLTRHTLWDVCPGADHPHNCIKEGAEDLCLTTDPTPRSATTSAALTTTT